MSAVANVAINLDSRGVPAKLKQIADRGKEVDRSLNGAAAATAKAGREFKSAGNSASRASSSFSNLAKGALKLAAAYATLNAAQSAVSAGIQRIESERRIEFLAKGYGEVAQLQDAATRSAQRFGTGQTEANRALADVFARLRPVGVSLNDIVSVYNGFNTAARISGSTAVESANAFTQLSQALGSGALRGDEFNSISEQVPGILTAISQETGVAQGKLRNYAAEGKITADVVIRALKRIETEGADQLAAALGGPEQAIRDFQNASEDVQVALTKAIVPEMAKAFRDLAVIIEGLEPSIRFIGGLIAETLSGFRTLVESIRGGEVVERLRQGGSLGFRPVKEREELGSFFGKERFAELERQARETAKATGRPFAEALEERIKVALKVIDRTKEIEAGRKSTSKPFKVGDVIVESTVAGGKVGGGGRSGPSPEEVLARQTEFGEQLLQQKQRELALTVEQDPLMRELLQISYERADAEERVKDAAAGQRDELLKTIKQLGEAKAGFAVGKSLAESLIGTSEQLDRVRGGFLEGVKIDEQLQKANQEADIFKQTMQGVGEIIGNQLRGAIDGLISGTADWNSILRDTLSQLGSLFLNAGLNQLAGPAGSGGILSFLGFGTRASGGPVSPGGTYIVGENGPEVLQMNRDGSGQVINNNQLSSAMNRYRRSGSGATTAAGGTTEAPGGGVAVADKPIDVRYTVERINNVEYVTADQFQAGMREAAKQGAAQGERRTIQKLQMSPGARRRLGL